MKKLTLEKLSEGLSFHNGSVAQIYIEFTDDHASLLSNFIAKYEEHINIMIQSHYDDGFIFQVYASSTKEIRRICDTMLEDIDVTDLQIFSIEEK
jgi:metal-responsive CopG/Arc/MetJ family transcriptional regulator